MECDAKRIYCGTTALGAFVIGSQLTVFSIGDCQAVLSSRGLAVSHTEKTELSCSVQCKCVLVFVW